MTIPDPLHEGSRSLVPIVPKSENSDYAAGSDLHVSHVCVFLIVRVDHQEIGVHWFDILTAGFGEHGSQHFKTPGVALEREQLIATAIGSVISLWAYNGTDPSFVTQQGTEVSCLVSRRCRRIDEVSVRFVNISCQHDRREAGRLILEDDSP